MAYPTDTCSASTAPRLRHDCWWPRTTDPATELPGLLLSLEARHGPVVRVRLSAAGWSRRPHCVEVDGRAVSVGYFSDQSTGLLTASCAGGAGISLRVVPADG